VAQIIYTPDINRKRLTRENTALTYTPLTPLEAPPFGEGRRVRAGRGRAALSQGSRVREPKARTEGAQPPANCRLPAPREQSPGGSTLHRCIDADRRQRKRSRGGVIAQRIPSLRVAGDAQLTPAGDQARQTDRAALRPPSFMGQQFSQVLNSGPISLEIGTHDSAMLWKPRVRFLSTSALVFPYA
jgi:hypothetical protein